MAEAVYLLCAVTSGGCALALLRTYLRRRSRVLLWSSLCFVTLTANNVVLFLDLAVFAGGPDLSLIRASFSAIATVVLVVGLIWSVE